jgi:hypothetical protein
MVQNECHNMKKNAEIDSNCYYYSKTFFLFELPRKYYRKIKNMNATVWML